MADHHLDSRYAIPVCPVCREQMYPTDEGYECPKAHDAVPMNVPVVPFVNIATLRFPA